MAEKLGLEISHFSKKASISARFSMEKIRIRLSKPFLHFILNQTLPKWLKTQLTFLLLRLTPRANAQKEQFLFQNAAFLMPSILLP